MAYGTGLAQAVVKYSNGQELSQGVRITRRWSMDMGIVVTGFTLFGMMALAIFNESLEEPTQAQPRVLKSKPRTRVAHYATDTARTRKKAA